MNVLGVTCSSTTAFLSLTRDGTVTDIPVERVDVGSLYEASEELEATLAEFARVLARLKPDMVTLLLPEATYRATHGELAPRVALETLVRLAGVRAGIPVETLSRPTVRARLKLPTKGQLATHVGACAPTPVGRHWAAGRNIATLAALAGEAGA